MPKVSVVIPAFNHAAFVRQAIDSVLTQSFTDLEVVVTDDGSSDATVEVIRGVSDPRVRLNAFPENRGAPVAHNDAIRRSTGQYLAVLSSDDYFLPGKLERQVAFLDAHPEVAAVFARPEFVDEQGKPFWNPTHAFANKFVKENRDRHAWLRHFFYSGNGLCHPTVLIRRECYDQVGLLDPTLMQLPDLDFWVRLAIRHEIHILEEKLTAFRVLARERNTSSPSREKLARHGWETLIVLRHYATLPDSALEAVFGPAGAHPPKVKLALEALSVGKPGYVQFGLETLRGCMLADPMAYPVAEYFRLVGELDPSGTQYGALEHRLVKNSTLLRAARTLARRLRGLNLGR